MNMYNISQGVQIRVVLFQFHSDLIDFSFNPTYFECSMKRIEDLLKTITFADITPPFVSLRTKLKFGHDPLYTSF